MSIVMEPTGSTVVRVARWNDRAPSAGVRRFISGMEQPRAEVPFNHHARTAGAAETWRSYTELRDRGGVTWSPEYGGYWVVTSYEAMAAVAHDDETFSSATANGGVAIPPVGRPAGFIEMDPPEFYTYRRLVTGWFTPKAVDLLAPLMQDTAHAAIDEFIETGTADLVHDLASVVPAVVTLRSLGLPIEHWRFCSALLHAQTSLPPEDPARSELPAGFATLDAMIVDAIERVAEEPQPTLLDTLVQARVGGEPLPRQHIIENCRLLLAGGIDTTAALVAGALLHLSEHPAARAALIDTPDRRGTACEEYLRYYSPVQALARTVTRDVELGGQQLRAGDRVLVGWGASNHDPAVFSCPDVIDLDRSPNRHAAFGLGIHRCLGSNLARKEFEVVLAAVLDRIPDFDIDVDRVERYPSVGTAYGFVRMPARFTPGLSRGGKLPAATTDRGH